MFEDTVILVKARAGKDRYFVTITSFLHPSQGSEGLSCILAFCPIFLHTCLPWFISVALLLVFRFVCFCFVGFFPPEVVNIHK